MKFKEASEGNSSILRGTKSSSLLKTYGEKRTVAPKQQTAANSKLLLTRKPDKVFLNRSCESSETGDNGGDILLSDTKTSIIFIKFY